ncbi:MAG: DUF2183 domain-containing protein [Bdellovibrionales bacterium]|nr:DUF2183 domain-containing protein [Bdellovibrionales bacterium]
MKFLVSFLVFVLSFTAQAVTSGQFAGPYGIIRIIAKDFAGNADTDGQVLYEAMDVPVQDSIIGPGKAINSADRGLQFICANRAQAGYECSIFIHPEGYGNVNPIAKSMLYKVTGTQADVYAKVFKTDANGEFHFVSVDGLFQVNLSPGSFEVSFQQMQSSTVVQQGLVVVNVEDTLKIAHIQNFWDSLNYNTNTKKRFMGMAPALQMLARNNPGFQFVYLTRPPELVAGKTERQFVVENRFPRGEFRSYAIDSTAETREGVLRDIMRRTSVKKVILIGHNGSPDPQVFQNVTKEFQSIQFYQYLHLVYSTSAVSELGTVLFPEQTGYVTAAELVVDWQIHQLLDPTESLKFIATMVDRVIAEDPETPRMEEYAIPSFVNCDDFQWRWSTEGDFKVLAPLREHLMNRCHMQAPLAGYSPRNEN